MSSRRCHARYGPTGGRLAVGKSVNSRFVEIAPAGKLRPWRPNCRGRSSGPDGTRTCTTSAADGCCGGTGTGVTPTPCEREAQVMAHARAHGVPVPEVFELSGSDMIMEREPARHAGRHGPPTVDGAQPGPGARPAARHSSTRRPAARTPARCFGDEHPDNQVLLHRDLHPINVILTSTGPVIIDWEGAARGPAMLDVAMTWVIVGFSDVPETGLAAVAVRSVQSLFTHSFVRAAGPLDRTWRAVGVPPPTDRPELAADGARPPGTPPP